MYLRLNSKEHQVVDTPVAAMLRRRVGDPNIFTYWHKKRRVWVCATWIRRSSRVCHEHFVWEGSQHDVPEGKLRGFLIGKTDAYRAWLEDKKVAARLYEKHQEDDAIEWAEEQQAMFDFERRHARQTLQNHPSWINFHHHPR